MTVLERSDGSRIAALLHDASLFEQRELLRDLTAAASIALENARLQSELRVRLDELQDRAPASSRRPTPSGGGSSATCTTARSDGW